MKHISVEVSDYEFIVLNEEIESARQYYTEVKNDSNYSSILIMTEDNAYEMRDLLESYILDEDTIKGSSSFEIIRDIHYNIVEEINWLPYCYDDEEEEDDE